MTYEQLKLKMDEAHYIYDETLATVLFVALQLGRPLLIEKKIPPNWRKWGREGSWILVNLLN